MTDRKIEKKKHKNEKCKEVLKNVPGSNQVAKYRSKQRKRKYIPGMYVRRRERGDTARANKQVETPRTIKRRAMQKEKKENPNE